MLFQASVCETSQTPRLLETPVIVNDGVFMTKAIFVGYVIQQKQQLFDLPSTMTISSACSLSERQLFSNSAFINNSSAATSDKCSTPSIYNRALLFGTWGRRLIRKKVNGELT